MKYCKKHETYYSSNYYCILCHTIGGNTVFNYVQNFEHSDEIKITYCKNKDEAQALANFLWNEKHRHYNSVHRIIGDLILLKAKWGVEPTRITTSVKP